MALHVLEVLQNGFSGVQGINTAATEDHFGRNDSDLHDRPAPRKFLLGPTVWRPLAYASGRGDRPLVHELVHYGNLLPFQSHECLGLLTHSVTKAKRDHAGGLQNLPPYGPWR